MQSPQALLHEVLALRHELVANVAGLIPGRVVSLHSATTQHSLPHIASSVDGGFEELIDRFASSQFNHVKVIVLPKGCIEARSAVAFVVPDPAVKRKLEPFGATLGLNCLAMVACRPSHR